MRAEQDRLKAIILVARIRQFSAILLIILVVGLSLLGCKRSLPRSPAPSPVPYAMATATSAAASAATATSAAVSAATATATLAAATAEPTVTPCGPPTGWVPYTVQAGDTLSNLALSAGISPEDVMLANCLESEDLSAGQVLYLPPLPTPTPCGTPPAGWTPYTVQAGDTLYRLALTAGVGRESVMQANCLESADLVVGQILYLPPLPTPTPTPCVPSPPAGWTLYTVRAGDTLFSLAVTRDTTHEYVMQVNCLDPSHIQVGQILYLPPLPISYEPPPASPPGPPPIEVAELPEWELKISRPGANVFKACHPSQASPWVDMLPPVWPRPSDPDSLGDVQLGERRFFFACAFTATDVTVKMSDGTSQQITPVTTLPNLDLEMNTATAVIDWPVLPTHTVGRYTVIMTDTNGITVSTWFTVITPTKAHILAVPSANPPGTPFDLYFVNFEKDVAHDIAFCHAGRTEERSYEPTSCHRRAVQMDEVRNDEGEIWWAHESWTAEATSLPAPLAVIAYKDTDRYALFWLR